MGRIKPTIEINDLSIKYLEYQRSLSKPWGKGRQISALSGITLAIEPGENVALIGRNGAGKSTLLKAISGMTKPSSGTIKTNGRVIILSGTNPGFIPYISGLDNLRELGLAYGVDPSDLEEFILEVREFAEIGDAIYRNVGGYSTGMRGKLGFGFITSLDPDILLIDETLGVGDRVFREKAQSRLRGFIKKSGTVIMSTHSLGLAKEICQKGILLDAGKLLAFRDIGETIAEYVELTRQ